MGLHKDIVDYFKSQGLPCFFHCDGNVEELIPILSDMHIAALHPMQERSNPSLIKMMNDLGQRLTFIGGVGIERLNRSRAVLIDHIKMLCVAGNYIFCFDGPVTESVDKKLYEEIIEDTENIEVHA